ncbi:flavonoid 3'-monooxygenase-like isoform X2 [Neltuma alba]|uniref:flavonoid 3'-monooxygenase-like isoform X2 n=1 Tax=Neltuma alba TaxID=207710 RepID=UPI0010A33F52|nr:flavonoid 3'-monooxygenase-like isoform X2 [Prosopis alba]
MAFVTSPWLLGLASLVLASLLYRLLNLFRRPSLSLPPGPKPWPIVGNMPHLGPVPHHALADLARSYGPLMHLRLGFVDVVVVASASVAEQILKVHDANFSSRPPNAGAKYMGYNYQDLVFAPYGPRWRKLRKISAVHLFSGKALEDFRHLRQEEVGRLTRNLASAASQVVNLGQLLNVCTTNALARAVLGRRVFDDGAAGCDPRADEFKSMVVEMMVLAGVFNIGDFIPALEWLDLQGVQGKMKKLHKRFDAFLTNIIEEHKVSQNEDHRHLLSTLLSLKEAQDDEGTKLTDVEIKALLLNMFAAGTDTSSSTTEWAIARDPKEWSDPLVFRPERFLPGGEKAGVDVRGNDFEVIPFGGGRRICAGMNLGLRVVQLLTATLAQAFDWELADGLSPQKLNMDEAYGLTLQRKVPLLAQPKPRLAPHLYSQSP